CRPGDLFVVRNVANLVPPYAPDGGRHGVSAALEYAVKHLRVQDIIIMGHACCGGIHALVAGSEGEDRDEFIGPWVDVARHALEKVNEAMPGADAADRARACELWNVRLSLDNLLTFPWVKDAVEKGGLSLHGWYFDLQSGELLEYDSSHQVFRPLVGRPHIGGARSGQVGLSRRP
ncbi:carbonic anhydrase, partial [uncultured Mailhella sp.]|uniref:carbonic anhydrase n=1 Tax=uncultured Mailhella sp. TaxID=1981031 RepID=UPI0025F8831F